MLENTIYNTDCEEFMSGLILSGKQTKMPYYIAELNLNIYSIEELCYYLYNHLYLIEDNFFDDKLIKYLSSECGLISTAQRLQECINQNGTFGERVKIVLSATAYYNEKEMEKIQEVLDEIGNKSRSERRKARADLLMERKKYVAALNAYNEILLKKDSSDSTQFCSDVWYNMGVAYIRMFLLNEAVEAFSQSYNTCPREELIDDMLRICLIQNNETEVLKVVAKFKVTDERLSRCREQIKQEKEKLWEQLPEELPSDKVVEQWKEDYRNAMTG